MRITFLTVLVVSTLATACGRADVNAAGDGAVAPVATAGSVDAPRTADAVPVATTLREITIPAGTQLAVTLDTAVGSDISRAEQPVTAHLTRPIHVHGDAVLPAGSRVNGVVTDATQSAKVKGRAHIAMRFDSLTPAGSDQRYEIRTAAVGRTAAATKEKDALEIAGPAAGGAIIGALVGGKKGALIGTAVGGGAGTGVVLSTRGKEVHLGKGAPITLTLAAPLTVRVKG